MAASGVGWYAGRSIPRGSAPHSDAFGHQVEPAALPGAVFAGCNDDCTASSVLFVVCVPSLSLVQPLDCWSDPNGGRCAHAHLLDAHLTTRLQPGPAPGAIDATIDVWRGAAACPRQRWLVDAK